MIMHRRSCTAVVLAGASILMLATAASAQELLFRIAAATQRGGEVATSVDPSAGFLGGTDVYDKVFFQPGARTYVTFDAQGDTHGGAALLIECLMDGLPCEVGSGAANEPGGGWSTLNKLPTNTGGANNCNDGGGGSADCHDNSIHKEWCMHAIPGVHALQLRLASSVSGSTAFYERATVYIDGSGSGWTGTNSNLRCVAPGDPLPWPLP